MTKANFKNMVPLEIYRLKNRIHIQRKMIKREKKEGNLTKGTMTNIKMLTNQNKDKMLMLVIKKFLIKVKRPIAKKKNKRAPNNRRDHRKQWDLSQVMRNANRVKNTKKLERLAHMAKKKEAIKNKNSKENNLKKSSNNSLNPLMVFVPRKLVRIFFHNNIVDAS